MNEHQRNSVIARNEDLSGPNLDEHEAGCTCMSCTIAKADLCEICGGELEKWDVDICKGCANENEKCHNNNYYKWHQKKPGSSILCTCKICKYDCLCECHRED